MDKALALIWQIALDAPLRRVFDYRPPVSTAAVGAGASPPPRARESPLPGVRVRVPFGRRQLVGVLIGTAADSVVGADKLKHALEVLDPEPVFDPATFDLLCWAADYYHHPIGEVMAAALPAALRAGQPASDPVLNWRLTAAGRRELAQPGNRRAPRQRALLDWLAAREPVCAAAIETEFRPEALRRLARRGWVEAERAAAASAAVTVRPGGVELNAAQAAAVASLRGALGRFAVHLLYGVTGSGKTEVYLQSIAAAIERGAQVLVLVPEIALTPQLVERFEQRFSGGVVAVHSALTEAARRDAWRAAYAGAARVVIGTRSAVFTPLPRLGLIVVDEEHDASYKQHEGFHYSARDLAVARAQRAQVPIVLGSATPSLETLDNAAQARYVRLDLPERVGAALPPALTLIDLRVHALEQGLSQPALQAITRHLAGGGQIIVFLNRRGYAPTLFCSACGWAAACEHCDARMTVHRRGPELRCHHCGARARLPACCGRCSQPLVPVGQGTERIEETLERLFPHAPLARLDRDTVPRHAQLEAVLARVRAGDARILVGTQMLTKGHHFPEVSLVLILDADQGLFASDFRATERLAQTITQVAGRAGRAARRGEVLIQTSYPEHPLLTQLIAGGYPEFAAAALAERRAAQWPPYSRLALLRAEARDSARLDAFLEAAAARGRELAAGCAVRILGPAPALIARRADHFRAHLLLETPSRAARRHLLERWLPWLEARPGPPGLRWSVDVDPLEVD